MFINFYLDVQLLMHIIYNGTDVTVLCCMTFLFDTGRNSFLDKMTVITELCFRSLSVWHVGLMLQDLAVFCIVC